MNLNKTMTKMLIEDGYHIDGKPSVIPVAYDGKEEFLAYLREHGIKGRWVLRNGKPYGARCNLFFIPDPAEYLMTYMYWSDKINS